MRRAFAPTFLAAFALLASCADLPEVQPGVCGNGIVDPGEDCDTFPSSSCRQPGEANACRFGCSKASDCATGWGCGVDGVCRRASGSFAPLGTVVAAGATLVRAGDLDGDGRADLLTGGARDLVGRFTARAHYFDTSGREEATFDVAALLAAPAIGDLDRDGVDDLAFSFFPGVAVENGRADRTLTPQAYPTLSLPAEADVRMLVVPTRAVAFGELVVLVDTFPGMGNELAQTAVTETNPNHLAALPQGPADLVGASSGTFIDDPAGNTTWCDEILLAFDGQTQLAMYQPCGPMSPPGGMMELPGALNPTDTPVSTIALPDGWTLTKSLPGLLVDDVDGNGTKDAMFSAVDANGREGVFVAFGNGKGAFGSTSKGPADGRAFHLPVPTFCGMVSAEDCTANPPRSLPLAVGNLTDDGHPDFVFQLGIVVSRGDASLMTGQGYDPVVFKLGGRWGEARIADVNADGALDVVAATHGGANLDLYVNGGDGIFGQATIDTTAEVSNVVVGDFDGDAVSDVAFREVGAHAETGGTTDLGDWLSIAFGRRDGPITTTRIGRLDRITEIRAARLPPIGPGSAPLATSIGVVSRSEAKDRTNVTVLFGSWDRQPLAPLGLSSITMTSSFRDSASSMAFGHFDRTSPDRVDLAIVGRTFDPEGQSSSAPVFRYWLGLADDAGQLASPVPGGAFDPAVDYPTMVAEAPIRFGVPVKAGDLDGDGIDEVVAILRDGPDGSTKGALVVGRVSQSSPATIEADAPFSFDATIAEGGDVELVDLDGDGRLDAVYVDASQGVVFWNDGSGHLGAPSPLPTSRPLVAAFAVLPNARDGRPALVVSSRQMAGEKAVLDLVASDPSRHLSNVPLDGVVGGVSLAVGDVTGDGVLDLATTDGTNLRIYEGVPVLR